MVRERETRSRAFGVPSGRACADLGEAFQPECEAGSAVVAAAAQHAGQAVVAAAAADADRALREC